MENQKRRIPQVDPVSHEGIRYEVVRAAKSRDFGQNGGVIAAVKESTGRELWTLVVYPVGFDSKEERDVQEVYITKLALSQDGKRILVENEAQRRFAVTLAERKIEELGNAGKEGLKKKR